MKALLFLIAFGGAGLAVVGWLVLVGLLALIPADHLEPKE